MRGYLGALSLEVFECIFDRPNLAGFTFDRLLSLCQGSRAIPEYALEFGILAVESRWNDPALWNVFNRGLNDFVLDALVIGPRPRDPQDLIDLAIEIDNYQREQWR